jgi:hypothetical protein
VSAAAAPPDRAHLAAMLKVFARSSSYFGSKARVNLLEYIHIAEDTIEAQAAMLRADLTELASHRRGRAEDAQANSALRTECDRLTANNAQLHTLTLAALTAAGVCGTHAAETIRQALERTA